MADELLQDIDAGIAARTARRASAAAREAPGPHRLTGAADSAAQGPRRLAERSEPAAHGDRPAAGSSEPPADIVRPRTIWDHVGWIEAFLAAQFLWGALIILPGAQQYRGYIRALPYLASLGMFALHALHRVPGPLAAGSSLLVSALLLLVLNLLHPTSQLTAGVAQCVFQLSIAAPLFWAHKAVRSPAVIERLLVLVFLMNALSAGLGVLQVYFPDRFMPSEFNSLGFQLNQYYLDGLTYTGSDGRAIVRPPGLSDQPGAAATAGALSAILGLGLLLRRRNPAHVIGILGAVTVGFAAIYLSQVRSILLATIGAGALLSLVALRRGRFAGAGWVMAAGGAVVVASFLWATSIGGASVADRFVSLQGSGAIEAYRTNRGQFVLQTVGELLDQYPLGAGVGRWGMMNTYFGDQAAYGSAPIYVEVQLTGWLLDGGVLMWLLYGGAAVLSMWAAFALSASRNPLMSEVAIITLGVNAYILVLAMSSPVFNTQMGILFWTLAGMLHGARTYVADRDPAEAPEQP
jgi:hypothetical protein